MSEKRNNGAETPNKVRVQLTLDPSTVELGKQLAAEDHRSLSNMVEVLFENEFKRKFPNAAPAAPQARGQSQESEADLLLTGGGK